MNITPKLLVLSILYCITFSLSAQTNLIKKYGLTNADLFDQKTVRLDKLSKSKKKKLYDILEKYFFIVNGIPRDLRCGLNNSLNFARYDPNSIRYADNLNPGRINGKINQILKDALLFSTFILINIDTSGLYDGENVSFYVQPFGTRQYTTVIGATRTVPCYKVIRKVTYDEFIQYIKEKTIPLFVKQNKIVKEKINPYASRIYEYITVKCPRCKGKGKINNPDYRKLNRIECPMCSGKGFIKKRIVKHVESRRKKITYWKTIKINFQ